MLSEGGNLHLRLTDLWKSNTVIAVLAAVLTLTGWFGYTVWQRSSQETSEWRSADEEMIELLARQSADGENKPQAQKAAQTHAKEEQQAKPPEEKSGGKPVSSGAAIERKEDEPAKKDQPGAFPKASEDQVLPEKKEAPQKDAQEDKTNSGPGGRIDLNKATLEQLTTLPGIGESKAKAIISYREQIGGRFKTAEQLLNVKGIGDKVLAKIKPHFTIEP
ncbi:MAG: competence protein ComEA [Paenibacillus sp.]|jgi:competence protein ComEA|nr:competence protein ComEA [Paenibacillus sp.]